MASIGASWFFGDRSHVLPKDAQMLLGHWHYSFDGRQGVDGFRYGGKMNIYESNGNLKIRGTRTWQSARGAVDGHVDQDTNMQMGWVSDRCGFEDKTLRFTYQSDNGEIVGFATMNLDGQVGTLAGQILEAIPKPHELLGKQASNPGSGIASYQPWYSWYLHISE